MNPTDLQIRIRRWQRIHRGVMGDIAREAQVSRQMVSRVLHGHRKSYAEEVEQLLRKHGCPGWEKK